MATPESPYGSSVAVGGGKPVRVHHLAAAKHDGTKLVMLTAYDAVTAQILDGAGTDMLLVGDSIGNVMLGHDSTLPVELDEMVVATRSVARATKRALVVADLPFGTYEAGPEQALASAVRLMKAGANAVKLEGGRPRAASVRTLTQAGIPVVGHLGFTPQSVNMLGGFRVQGRGEAAEELLADARALAEAGAIALVLEMVPEPLAARVTESLEIPTIGIGAGARCDGQVLVWTDMAGMTEWSPRFAHQFGQVGQALQQAAADYCTAVRETSFPAEEHWFSA
ncbi:3-methyl-2-oxobutanoate hydroxymethyltransferase [Actinomyces naeslundii]|uniref:3-methyl-2-oxobutanoate hydroxymethyltransferase n=1 Tax=Actinomyces naeslundii TaxID=1655 RepID=UPI00096EB5C8|nr:3-methyl-2-oxobutanoate hydroxymethyltransferase [Actinomyces naeslundii]OMG21992.1 3-methyl-2-oxobutanoate hydroxymethyltransferase [Actinomyces naeslundii]